MRKIFSVTIVSLIVLPISIIFSLTGTSEAPNKEILYVGGTGPGNFTNIHTAVEHASVGTLIMVYQGIYQEHLHLDKSLTLLGANKNTTVIDGGGVGFVVTLAADGISLSGFTITHSGTNFPFAGIYVTSDENTISGNIITDNYYGMQLSYDTGYNLISNNLIFHNMQCGIYFNHSSNNRLIGNTVHDHPVNGFGLYEFSNNNTIVNNTLSNNMFCGVNIRESYNTYLVGNTFIQDRVGLHLPSPIYNSNAQSNIFSENLISLEEEREISFPILLVFSVLAFFSFLVCRKRFA